MTHDNMSNILASIGEAKRALDAEPDYQRRIRNLEDAHEDQRETVAKRELHILALKQANDELMLKLRSVEAERDDAGFRALEEADKVQTLSNLVHSVINDALKAVSAVEGRESIVVNKVNYEADQREICTLQDELSNKSNELWKLQDDMKLAQEQLHRPFATATVQGTEGGSGSGEISSSAVHDHEAEALAAKPYDFPPQAGKSEPDPTTPVSGPYAVASPITESSSVAEGQSDGPFAPTETTPLQPVTSTTAETTTAVASNASGPERNRDESTRFKDRKYYDVTYFVSLNEWLAKGGSYDDYRWRPAEANTPLPEPSRASQQSS